MGGSLIDKYSDDEFRDIVNGSYSIREVAEKVGYKATRSGGGRDRVKAKINALNIDTSHFKTTGRQYEKSPTNKIIDPYDVLKNPSTVNRTTLRTILTRENLLEYRCSECGNDGHWNGKELTLQVHHQDGNIANNELSNLVFLCPNCHSQTNNYGNKNIKKKPNKKYYCTECGAEITKDNRTGLCKTCANKKMFTKEIPPKETLINTIKELKFRRSICYKYHVCDHTLNKWLDAYNLPTHIAELHSYIEDNNL